MSPRLLVQSSFLFQVGTAIFSKEGLDVSKVLSDPGSVFDDHVGDFSDFLPQVEDPCLFGDCDSVVAVEVEECEGEYCDDYVAVEECEDAYCEGEEKYIPVEPVGCETGGCNDGDHPILHPGDGKPISVEPEGCETGACYDGEHPILILPGETTPIPVESEGCETGACYDDEHPILIFPEHPESSKCTVQLQDSFCQDLNGEASYCKFYKYPQVCQYGDQPCSCGDISGKSAECDAGCPEIYSPICGSDGVTYSNECIFERMVCEHHLRHGYEYDLYLLYDGECYNVDEDDCDGYCTLEYDPICGSDGVTYSNPCTFKQQQCSDEYLELDYEGECHVVEDCERYCTYDYSPVCGSDGVTYSNSCAFEVEQCKSSYLELAYEGECVNPSRCRFYAPCTEEYSPVCGSDGVTYSNLCYFQMAQCEETDLELAYEHACYEGEPEPEPCVACFSTAYEPVCGSDGVTYDNECYLLDAACAAGGSITVASDGPCEEQYECFIADCVGTYALICGSDGYTYTGSCDFLEAQCRDPSLTDVPCAH